MKREGEHNLVYPPAGRERFSRLEG
jgi:hypothetical protein